MGCRGVHFAITPADVKQLKSFADEQDRLDHLSEEIEESYFEESPQFVAESDKAWDAIHRALSDGTMSWSGGTYPLNHTILGGELLYTEPDYIMSLKTPKQVREVAAALTAIDEAQFRSRYFAIDANDYDGELSEDDFGYTWEGFQEIRDLFTRAAADERYVLFTADQ